MEAKSSLSWFTSPRIKLWLSNVYNFAKKLLGTVDYKTLAIQLLAATTKLPVDKILSYWNILEELVSKAAVVFPGSSRGTEKYAWVIAEFKKVASELRDLFVDKIIHEVITYLESKGTKT